jgi:hypothetical protein
MIKAKEIVDSQEFGDIMFIRAKYGHGGRVGYDKEWRAKKIKDGWDNQSNEKKIEIASNTLNCNTQRIEIEVEGIKFKSINEAARWAVDKYSIGRNTAIRYIKEGRSFSNKKQLNYNYNGTYKATKYL